MTALTIAGRPSYPARLSIDYPERLDRLTTLVRIVMVIPIAIVLALVSGGGGYTTTSTGGYSQTVSTAGLTIGASLSLATALMLIFRQRYPRWWFDFQLALQRFGYRVGSYIALLRDEYPSTEDEQAVHLELDYPDAPRDLNRWLPIVKWLLAIPHYIVLFFLVLFAFVATVVAWIAILATGRYPRPLFDFVVGVGRWALRVEAYAFLLITDRYPPFSLE
jgi:hypothetical protein